MKTRKSVLFKILSGVFTALFLCNTVLYGMEVPVDNLAPEPEAFVSADGADVVQVLGEVAEDMVFMSVTRYIAEIFIAGDQKHLRERLIADFTSDGKIPFTTDTHFETFIKDQEIDLKNITVEEGIVSIPFTKNGKSGTIHIASSERASELIRDREAWALSGEIAYFIEAREEKPEEDKDLKGLDAPHTDPILQNLFAEKNIIEISLDEESDELKANKIVSVKDYIPGVTTPDIFLGPVVDINQIFVEEEIRNIKEWLKAHPIRGEPVKFRIALASGAISWKDGLNNSNISHTGVNDGVIYIGGTFLAALMRDGNEEMRANVLDEDEYQHLQGLRHGDAETYKDRLDSVREALTELEVIEAELKNEDVIAQKARLSEYIDADNEEAVFRLLSLYNQFSFSMSHAPVESRYPIKKAVVLLEKEQQDKLYTMLTEGSLSSLYEDLIIVDELKLLHTDLADARDWIKRFAPELEGRSLWHISPEIWHEAGGLSRVMQYHGVGMKDLIGESNVRFRQLEPQYINRIDADGNAQTLDYSKDITHKVDNLEEVDRFTVMVGGKEIEAIVSRGINDLGVETFMIRDAEGFYTHSLYNYREPWESLEERPLPSWEEFTVFYSKASLEFVKRFENKEREELEGEGYKWRSPLLHTNDSQTALVSVYARIQRDEELRKQEEDPDYTIDPILEDMILAFTTHTYRNRKDYNIKDGHGDRVLDFMGIPMEYRELFKHLGGDGHVYDIASAGLRTADWQGAVARAHRDDVAQYDEWVNTTTDPKISNALSLFGTEVNVVGVSNGDNRAASSKVFRALGEELFGEDFDYNFPTPEQILAINREAKIRLRLSPGQKYYTSNEEPEGAVLNPDQMVFAYTGRLVPEKFELDKEVIRRMVRRGVQVVVYGNVQTNNPQSDIVRDMLLDLIRELAEERAGWQDKSGFGKLLFVPRFIQADQRNLMPAVNVGFFLSTPVTEAAGYTEADFSSCGGCVWAPTRTDNGIGEGLLSAQGLPLNPSIPGEGNTIMADYRGDDYNRTIDAQWRAAETIINLGLEGLAPYQATSVKFSRVIEAKFTSAQYLREFSMAIRDLKRRREKRDAYIKRRKREEMERTLLHQLMPDPESNPKEYVEREITTRIMDGRKDATELFFTSSALVSKEDKLEAAAKVANNILAVYNQDGSYDSKVRSFFKQLVSDSIYWTGKDEDSVELAQSMQVIAGQVLMILSWIDNNVKGAENMRLTTDKERMAHSPKSTTSPSFIDKETLPTGAQEVQEEGSAGFFWRGVEKIKKLGENIINSMLGSESEVFSSSREKAVLYLMDHGFIKIPDNLKNIRTEDPDGRKRQKRVTPVHDTLFLQDFIPGTTQYASTGAGHFQGRNLDIKYITEGFGVQVNVLYDNRGRVKDVIVHEVQEGQWTLALPGYVDYMINLGGLRFNDMSVTLTVDEARQFNPNWDFSKGKAPSPEIQPLLAYYKDGEFVYVKDKESTVNPKFLGEGSYSDVVGSGNVWTLFDLYNKLETPKRGQIPERMIANLIAAFIDENSSSVITAVEYEVGVTSDVEPEAIENIEDPQSFGHVDGLNTFIEDNIDFLGELLPLSTDSPVLIRIPVEILQIEGAESFKIFLQALADQDNIYVELFSYTNPEIETSELDYTMQGLERPRFPESFQQTRENTLTIMAVENGEQFQESEHSREWNRLGKNFANGSNYGYKNTIVSPVGFNYDGAGLMRSVFLGLRLTEIAKNNYTEHDPFVNYTLLQYRHLCLSQGKDIKEFTLKGQDLVNLAISEDVKEFVGSLNRIIRLLPIMPINVEELRLIYERAREALIRA